MYTQRTEKQREARREWGRKNPERLAIWRRNWREKNSEKLKELKKKDYILHRDKRLATNERYRTEHKERLRAIAKAKYDADPALYRTRAREWRAKNLERFLENRARYKAARKVEFALIGYRKAAKERGVKFDLTVEWLRNRYDAGICELSGLPFDFSQKRGPNSPSVDRRDPKGDYTQANCRMILWSINRALSNLGEDYYFMVFQKILERRAALQAPA
jgi:hypothetical protein